MTSPNLINNSRILIVMSVYLLMLSQEVNCLQTQYNLFVYLAMELHSTASLTLQSAASRIDGSDYSIVFPLVDRIA